MGSPADQHPSRSHRRFLLRRPTWRGWFTIVLILGVVAAIVAWAVDYRTLGNRVQRNVTVENVGIGRVSGTRLLQAMHRADTEYGRGKVAFVVSGKRHEMTAAEIGLHLDTSRTLASARRLGRDDPPLLRPVYWLSSLFVPRRAPVTVRLDQAKLARALATLPGQTPVTEPRVVGTIDTIGTTAGIAGFGFDPDVVARQIERVARDGTLPLRIPLVAETVEPTVSDSEIGLLAERARTLTNRDIDLSIPGATMTATPPLLRSWIDSVVPAGSRHARLVLDADRVRQSAKTQLGVVVTAAKPATFTVEGGGVLLVPHVDGLKCCGAASGRVVMSALEKNRPSAVLPLERFAPSFTTTWARGLGITTPLGAGVAAQPQQLWEPEAAPTTSTEPDNGSGSGAGPRAGPDEAAPTTTVPTRSDQAQPGEVVVPIPALSGQAQNIDRAIRSLRGRIIMPGKELSLNAILGPPSPSRGYVAAQVLTTDGPTWISGGGTDLVAAGLFSAAFNAGLDIPVSTRHSSLPNGLAPGIEATIGWSEPDLVIANPSKRAVLVWVERVGGTLRVRLFGTPFTRKVSSSTSSRPFGPDGVCQTVSVRRTRVMSDGTQKVDTFPAIYGPVPTARDDPDRVICRGRRRG